MRTRPYHYLLLAVALGAATVLYKKYRTLPALDTRLPGVVTETGSLINTRSFAGKYVLVSYFQSWCRSCATEIPSMLALQQSMGPQKLALIFITDEPFSKINQFRNATGLDIACYRSAKSLKSLGIHVFPSTYLIDKNGHVVLEKMEGFYWNAPEVRALMR